jgi:oligoribonuclease NrnB/cAMP/cGMP phosphodiesterase (DHH superfamily)
VPLDQIADTYTLGLDDSKHCVILDNNKSGAMLAWEFFHPTVDAPELIRHIEDYDLWRFKISGTKEFNKALWAMAPWSFKQWDESVCSEKLILEGAAILRAHDANVQSVVKGATRKCSIQQPDSTMRVGLAANCSPFLTSDVGHELANLSGTYGLCWHINKDGKCICSLRSNGDYDVSAIARTIGGGGGHKNAAGFETTIEVLLSWLR